MLYSRNGHTVLLVVVDAVFPLLADLDYLLIGLLPYTLLGSRMVAASFAARTLLYYLATLDR